MNKLLQWVLPAAVLLSGTAAVAEPVIVETRMAAPNVLVAVMLGNTKSEDGYNSAIDPLDLDPAKWRVNGVQPQAIYRYSLPLDEQRADLATLTYPVTVQHRVYLKLAEPVQEGASYAVTSPYGPATMQFGSSTAYCESIKVNQVGYSSRATSRYANYGVYMGDGGSIQFAAPPNYEVIKEATGQLIASGAARYMGNETVTGLPDDPNMKRMFSGEHVYRLAMNSLPPGGLYYVKVAGCGRSRSFGVGDAYTREAAYVAMRGFYHQRCGTALTAPFTDHTRAICHAEIADTRSHPNTDEGVPVPPGTPTRPMWGGHHDAGNFQRLARHQIIPIQLFGYYEAFPENFIDGQYNLPESGNGIPDIVDEAMWAVKSWEKLQIDNAADPEYGGVMAGTVEQPGVGNKRYFGYGNAANNPQVEGTWPVEINATATAAGMFAQGSRLIRPYNPIYADELLARALRAWAFLKRTTDVNLSKTHFMYGALQLYLATGEAEYHEVFKQAARTTVIAPPANSFPDVYAPGNMTATGQTAHFISYLLPGSQARDATIVAGLRDKLFYNADVGTYMGPMPENDPYPQGISKFLGWGSGVTQGRYADPVVFAWRLSNDAAKKQLYLNAVSQYADYAMGLNPMGMSYYTGLGWDQPNSPLHMDSYFTKYGLSDSITSEHVGKPIGNVPGFLIMGPAAGVSGWSYQTAVSKKIFPHVSQSMPAMRRFAQGWSMIDSNEGGVETTMWNAAMLGFLHNTGNSAGAMCTSAKPLTQSEMQACPAGMVGAVTRKRDHVCVAGTWTPTPWQALENTCVKACTGPQPADETRNLTCPAGQYGAITEKRTYSCAGGGWTAGAWIQTANTCSVAPPLNPVCEIDRLNNKVTATGLSSLQCVQRNDTNAIGYPANYAVTLPGAPADQFDLNLFENVAANGSCSRYVKSVRCVVPEAAKPACHVSPWDGSLQVSGLGTELACVKRDDTGVKALNVRGRASFPAPVAAGVTVSTFRKTDAAGNCADPYGQMTCQALAAPAPACAMQPNGAMLVTGLNDSIACLSRNDISEQQLNVDNRAIFSKGGVTSATRI
ncbi:MAG TPA: glycoside hydrolase family 9 protein, partial [Burkholderiaceae bacterium]